MTVTEPIVSIVAYSPTVGWGAKVTDSAGHVPEDFDANACNGEMAIASLLIAALGNQPRTLTIVHPHGYRGNAS